MAQRDDGEPALHGDPPDRVLLPLSFDPQRLRADLDLVESSGWIDHFVTGNYLGSWQILPLRGPAGAAHPVLMSYSDPSCTEFADTLYLDPCPYFREVLAAFACPLQSARLMRLSPGSRIKEHTDHDLAFDQGTARLHVPIVTNAEVDFRVNGRPLVMRPGECWYLRLIDPHAVVNRGETDRVHLVIDATVNDWLRGLVTGAV